MGDTASRVATGPSRSMYVFDTLIAVLGGMLAVTALLVVVADPRDLQPAALLGIPLIAVMARFPVLLGRGPISIEVGFESCVLVFLAVTVPPWTALLVWSAGVLLGELTSDKRARVRAFNTGLGIVSGGVALWVLGLVADLGSGATADSPHELLAVGLACVAYFVCDWVLTLVSIALEGGHGLRAELVQPGTLTALAVFVAVDSLGYLAAMVFRNLPLWSTLLLAVPVALILFAALARSRGDEHARRLRVLFAAAQRAQTVQDRDGALTMVRDAARDLLRDRRVALREQPPGTDEIGAVVAPGEPAVWVVGPALARARSTVQSDQAALAAVVTLAEDTFARLRLVDEMAHLARHDPLTGLPNRAVLLDRVEHALAGATRRAGALAVLFCDVDGFKQVNDRFGHAAGDVLLQEVGRRIASCVRSGDTVARLGGDEFAVLLEGVTDPSTVDDTCARILDVTRPAIDLPSSGSVHAVSVSTSIGVATSQPQITAAALLRNADMAMYHAKALGKDRVEHYQVALLDDRMRRIELVEQLRQAIEERAFELHFQPVVCLQGERVIGLEVLLRWRRDGRLVPPDEFIPVAEETGLIVPLGELVLELAAEAAPAIRAAAGQPLSLGVNVAAGQLRSSTFASAVRGVHARMGDLELVLELTEHDFVDDGGPALTVMAELAAEDVRFAIDDFGVGFSSIGYLQRLPVRILKIDRSFVVGVDGDQRACELLHSMVAMGRGLGLDVVVEGIESSEQLGHVTAHCGAVIGQGFLLGRPLPLAETVALLRRPVAAAPGSVDADVPVTA